MMETYEFASDRITTYCVLSMFFSGRNNAHLAIYIYIFFFLLLYPPADGEKSRCYNDSYTAVVIRGVADLYP